jgi:hypothetical protein
LPSITRNISLREEAFKPGPLDDAHSHGGTHLEQGTIGPIFVELGAPPDEAWAIFVGLAPREQLDASPGFMPV